MGRRKRDRKRGEREGGFLTPVASTLPSGCTAMEVMPLL